MKSFELTVSFPSATIDLANNTSEIINAFSRTDYINVVASPALVVFQKGYLQFMVSPLQLSLRANSADDFSPFQSLLETTQEIINKLIPDGSIFAFRITSIEDQPECFEQTLSFSNLRISEAQGIGYRFLISNPTANRYNGFKYEPLLADSNKRYFEASILFILNSETDLVQLFQNAFEQFNKYRQEILDQINL